MPYSDKKEEKKKKSVPISRAEYERAEREAKELEKEQDNERKFLDVAMKRLKEAIEREDHNRKDSLDDLRFSYGQNRWDSKIQSSRQQEGRPCLQFDLLNENIRQVVGDQRHNKVKCKVRAVDSSADPEIAKIRAGMIADAEFISGAERIYDYSMEMMCRGGYAAWEIKVRYCIENPFLQEMYLQRIENPHTVYLGPGEDENYVDSQFGFKLEKIGVEEFKELYPDAELPGDQLKTGTAMGYDHWWTGERVTIADYYVIKHTKKEMALLSDGRVMEADKAREEVKDAKRLEKAEAIVKEHLPELTGMGANMMSGGPGSQPNAIGSALIGGRRVAGGAPGLQGGTPGMVPPQGPPQGMAPPGTPPAMPQGAPPPMQPGAPPIMPGTESPSAVDAASHNLEPTVGTPAMPEKEEKESETLHIVKTRDILIPKVKHYLITCNDILSEGGIEGEDFPGRYIPLIMAKGPEINIDGKPFVMSFIRFAKDPQRNYDYWVSAAAESVALAPKAEWIGTAKQFQGYENDYAQSNMKNLPFLKYNIDDSFLPTFVPPAPQRVTVKEPPIGIFTEMGNAKLAVKDALGMHDRDVGNAGNERSAQAILAVQKPADIGAFVFFDNLKRAIEHSCRVMNAIIPDIYDSERDARIRDETDNTTYVPINTTVKEAISRVRKDPMRYAGMSIGKMQQALREYGKNARFNDITEGEYDVVSTTGPAYATQRAESAEQMLRLASVDKKMLQFGADLIVRSMDFYHAEELADRLERTLPPGMAKPKEGKQPQPPMPIPPQTKLLMQQISTETAKQQKEIIKAKVELIKLYKETQETDVEIRKKILQVLEEMLSPEPMPGEEGWDPQEHMRIKQSKLLNMSRAGKMPMTQ